MNIKMNLVIRVALIVFQISFISALKENDADENSISSLRNNHFNFEQDTVDSKINSETNNLTKTDPKSALIHEIDALITYALNSRSIGKNSGSTIRQTRSIQSDSAASLASTIKRITSLETQVELSQKTNEDKNSDLKNQIESLKEDVMKIMYGVDTTRKEVDLITLLVKGQDIKSKIRESQLESHVKILNSIDYASFGLAHDLLLKLDGNVTENVQQIVYEMYSFRGDYYGKLTNFAEYLSDNNDKQQLEIKTAIYEALYNELQKSDYKNNDDITIRIQQTQVQVLLNLVNLLYTETNTPKFECR